MRGCIREVNIKEAHQYVALMRSMEKLAYAHLPDNGDDGYFAKRMADVPFPLMSFNLEAHAAAVAPQEA